MRKLLIAMCLLAMIGCAKPQAKVSAGDRWIYQYSNPFEYKCYEYKVIAVKDGFVLYNDVKFSWPTKNTSRVRIFVIGSHKAKAGESCPE